MHVPVINLEESPVTPDAESRQPSAVLHHDDISEILQSVMTMTMDGMSGCRMIVT